MALTEFQQHLLNYFKSTHVSSYEDAQKAFGHISNKLDNNQSDNSQTLLGEISVINRKLKEFDLAIVESIDEFTSEKLFILINTSSNNILQETKIYDKNLISLLSEIIKECVLSASGNVKETYCLNLNSHIGVSKTEIQSLLKNLINQKLLISRDGIISLGMRTIVELEPNLKESYPDDIHNCPLCKLICIQGFICNYCNTKYHLGCIQKYVTSKSCKCFTCKENLENLELSGNFEKDITDTEQNDMKDIYNSVQTKRRKKM